MAYQVPNIYLRQFFHFLGGYPDLLKDTEQTPESLNRLGGSNSFRDYCQFFYNAREQLKEPAIGLILGDIHRLANMHGPLSVALSQSTSVRDCLELLLRFLPLRSQSFKTSWYEDKDNLGIEIQFQEDAGIAHTSVTETLMLSLTSIISVISQQRVKPSCLELNYPQPAYSGSYPEAFHAASFRFSQTHLRLLISRDDASYQTTNDTDDQLRTSVLQRCEELLRGETDKQTTSNQLQQIFADNPGRLWTLQDVAKYMNTSERTIQRRLKDEGNCYKKLHDDWLSHEARRLLLEKTLSVETITALIGYSDVSNFRSAFRRWFGCSPQEYRNRQLAVLSKTGSA